MAGRAPKGSPKKGEVPRTGAGRPSKKVVKVRTGKRAKYVPKAEIVPWLQNPKRTKRTGSPRFDCSTEEIVEAIKARRGNMNAAARDCDLDKSTLYRRMSATHIVVDPETGEEREELREPEILAALDESRALNANRIVDMLLVLVDEGDLGALKLAMDRASNVAQQTMEERGFGNSQGRPMALAVSGDGKGGPIPVGASHSGEVKVDHSIDWRTKVLRRLAEGAARAAEVGGSS